MKKAILITGGTGKIGSRLCRHFAEKNYKVLFTSRSHKKVNDLVGKISSDEVIPIVVDFTVKGAVEELFAQLERAKVWPEIIIHNARNIDSLKIESDGISSRAHLMAEYELAVAVPYEVTMKLRAHGLQNVIFISSMYGVVAPSPSLYTDFEASSPIQYGLAKSAQIHLTKELAVRLAPDIRVNCVSFGGVRGRVDREFEERYKALTPLTKMLEEEDVAGPVEFLVSDQSKNMTGHNLIVDGGWTIW